MSGEPIKVDRKYGVNFPSQINDLWESIQFKADLLFSPNRGLFDIRATDHIRAFKIGLAEAIERLSIGDFNYWVTSVRLPTETTLEVDLAWDDGSTEGNVTLSANLEGDYTSPDSKIMFQVRV